MSQKSKFLFANKMYTGKENYLKFKVALEDTCNPKADSYPFLDEKRNMMLRGLGCCSFTLENYPT